MEILHEVKCTHYQSCKNSWAPLIATVKVSAENVSWEISTSLRHQKTRVFILVALVFKKAETLVSDIVVCLSFLLCVIHLKNTEQVPKTGKFKKVFSD